MRIGIDIDDVIAETSPSMKNYIERYDTTGDVSKYLVEIMRGEIPTQPVKDFIDQHILSILKNAKVKAHASEVLQRLINTGDELYIITSRGEKHYKGSENFTLEYFKTNHIPYTKIFFNSFEKARICKENQIDVMVDDSTKYCMEIQQAGMQSILFTSAVNQAIDVPITRVNDWLELEQKLLDLKITKC